MKPFAEEVREIICIYYAITGGGYYTALERDVNAICEAVRRRVEGMKDGVPNYPKGSDGEVLKHLQLGYNQAIEDILKEIK